VDHEYDRRGLLARPVHHRDASASVAQPHTARAH
jgi:hypothetical protein